MVVGSHQRIRSSGNEEFNVEINGKSITRVHKVKSLGLLIDEHLTWKDHVREVVKQISKAFGDHLNQLRPLSKSIRLFGPILLTTVLFGTSATLLCVINCKSCRTKRLRFSLSVVTTLALIIF